MDEKSVLRNMEAGDFSNKDGLSTSTTIPINPNEAEQTLGNGKRVRYKKQKSGTSYQGVSRGLGTRRTFKRFSKCVSIANQVYTPAPLVNGVDDETLWTDARSGKAPALLVLWWSLLALIMYIMSIYDLIADCLVIYQFHEDRKIIPNALLWSIISINTLIFSYVLQCCFSFYEVIYTAPKEFGRLSNKRYAIPLFLLLPWIIVLIGIKDTYKNQYTRRLETAYILMFIETITETISQCAIQLNAICVYTHTDNKTVTVVQWCSVSSSLLFLSIGIAYSVIFYNNKNTSQWDKLLFCVFGGITTVSRLLLCSGLSTGHPAFYIIPWITGLLTTSLTWLVIRTFSCFGKHRDNLNKYNIWNLPMLLTTLCSWMTSFIFNCFSPSGLPVSVLMCVLAGVDFYIKSGSTQQLERAISTTQFERTISIINISLTAFVLVCNILFSFIPMCKNVEKAWLEGEGEEDDDDPYHFIFY